MKIGDIYAGKPDASDEIRERGYEEFANTYIKPTGVNIDGLASTDYGTPYFIMGDKGTGKTRCSISWKIMFRQLTQSHAVLLFILKVSSLQSRKENLM